MLDCLDARPSGAARLVMWLAGVAPRDPGVDRNDNLALLNPSKLKASRRNFALGEATDLPLARRNT